MLSLQIISQAFKFSELKFRTNRASVARTIAVVYELTKRTQEKLFADWAQ